MKIGDLEDRRPNSAMEMDRRPDFAVDVGG